MAPILTTKHLSRYRDVARLFWKYGRGDLVRRAGLEDALRDGDAVSDGPPAAARELADDLEALGPTYVKLGQLLSTRADLLPVPYLEALSRLQDGVEPVPFDELAPIVRTELGMPLAMAFRSFDPEPLAAASLGQVHRATLPDGRPVAVKVQRPRIRDRIAEDLEALREVAEFLDRHTRMGEQYGFVGIVEQFRRSLVRELDYRQEAQNQVRFAAALEEFERIVVPLPVEGYTSARVLTMDYIRGTKVSPLALLGPRAADGHELADELFRAYLKQVLVDGFFHADPHPGNVFVTADGRIALLDLGMVAHVTPSMQERLLRWILAISEGRGDDAAEIALRLGDPREGFDEAEFRRRAADLVADHHGLEVSRIEIGRTVLAVARICGETGIRAPHELTMLGKALLNLDQIGRVLDPGFDPQAAVRRHAAELIEQRVRHSFSASRLLSVALDTKEFVERLPERLNQIVENVAGNKLRIKVDTIDETRLIQGMQKIANRITVGLVLAALILAAAMLMRVRTDFTLLGYPGLAIVLFLGAAGGGIALMLSILMSDEHRR